MTKDKMQINWLKLIGASFFFIIPAPETKEMRDQKHSWGMKTGFQFLYKFWPIDTNRIPVLDSRVY